MRYLPLTPDDRRAMLARIGAPAIESLYRDVPEFARLPEPVDLPSHQGELGVERGLARVAERGVTKIVGQGNRFGQIFIELKVAR